MGVFAQQNLAAEKGSRALTAPVCPAEEEAESEPNLEQQQALPEPTVTAADLLATLADEGNYLAE